MPICHRVFIPGLSGASCDLALLLFLSTSSIMFEFDSLWTTVVVETWMRNQVSVCFELSSSHYLLPVQASLQSTWLLDKILNRIQQEKARFAQPYRLATPVWRPPVLCSDI